MASRNGPVVVVNIVPFDRDRHGPFVYETFVRSLTESWPWGFVPWRPLLDEMKTTLAHPDTVCLVAELPEADDAFIGWVCCIPSRSEVTFAYTRYAYRKKFRVMSRLLSLAGMDPEHVSTSVRFWTRATTRIMRVKKWQLWFRSTDEHEGEPCSATA